MIKFAIITFTILSCMNLFIRLEGAWQGFFSFIAVALGLILFFFGGIYSFLEQAHGYLPVCGAIMMGTGILSLSLPFGSSDD
jgi:hypothetical protein